MPTKTKSLSRDRKLISSQPHELAYAAKKSGKSVSKVKTAKKALGRSTSRSAVMAKVGGRAKSSKKK